MKTVSMETLRGYDGMCFLFVCVRLHGRFSLTVYLCLCVYIECVCLCVCVYIKCVCVCMSILNILNVCVCVAILSVCVYIKCMCVCMYLY